ncbi:hypothetical protein [Streptomyces sp. NBC_00259]|uniref:hypothetical protein n=1 Tax=Streptomyces sp. NBC_00259 TaxID=2903643 RepID=UPI002E2BFB8C|nr:hypothetical protein [Streptomyces sp. NBC_00259]
MNATSVGALLLCRAEPAAVRPSVALLRERFLLAAAGRGWSVLVPEDAPWLSGTEPVDRVLSGWATALAVATNSPALALWWDADRAGYTLAAGFRRPVGYVWLADGTPVGEDEAMQTFAARLALDPVLDVQALEPLTRADRDAEARARLVGLIAVLARTGLDLPEGLAPGAPADRLRGAAHLVAGPGRAPDGAENAGTSESAGTAMSAETPENTETPENAEHGEAGGVAAQRPPKPPRPHVPAVVQIAAGLPLTLWGLARRSAGWTAAGAILLVHGILGLARERGAAP